LASKHEHAAIPRASEAGKRKNPTLPIEAQEQPSDFVFPDIYGVRGFLDLSA